MEAFILRIYREKNTSGFVKAFTEDPEALTSTSSGAVRVIQILKLLYIRIVYLYPRSHESVNAAMAAATKTTTLDNNTMNMDEVGSSSSYVEEINISLSRPMKSIQTAILAAMKVCLAEVKKTTSNIGIC